MYKRRDDNELRTQDYYRGEDEWNKSYQYILERRADKTKILNKYETLLNKWDSLVVIKLGEGDENVLIQKTIEKKSFYYVAEDSDTSTNYVRLGERWNRYHGLESNRIYKVKDEKYFKLTPYQWITLNDGKSIKAYKPPEPNKSTKQTYAHIDEKDFVEGHVVYINLVQKKKFQKK